MKQTLISLNDYHFECNQNLTFTILPFEGIDPIVHELFSHIINAHGVWMDRLLNRESRFDVWELHEQENYLQLVQENYSETDDFIKNSSEEELNSLYRYKNTKGTEYENSIGDTLMHIFNHTTHHRGQIIMRLRADGLDVPVTDYIFLKRKKVS